jgi:hypothetical protein
LSSAELHIVIVIIVLESEGCKAVYNCYSIGSRGANSVKEPVPVMGIHRLRESKNHSPTELDTELVQPHHWRYVSSRGRRPQTERVVQTSDQINIADLNCKPKVNVGI